MVGQHSIYCLQQIDCCPPVIVSGTGRNSLATLGCKCIAISLSFFRRCGNFQDGSKCCTSSLNHSILDLSHINFSFSFSKHKGAPSSIRFSDSQKYLLYSNICYDNKDTTINLVYSFVIISSTSVVL